MPFGGPAQYLATPTACQHVRVSVFVRRTSQVIAPTKVTEPAFPHTPYATTGGSCARLASPQAGKSTLRWAFSSWMSKNNPPSPSSLASAAEGPRRRPDRRHARRVWAAPSTLPNRLAQNPVNLDTKAPFPQTNHEGTKSQSVRDPRPLCLRALVVISDRSEPRGAGDLASPRRRPTGRTRPSPPRGPACPRVPQPRLLSARLP
jgi:hypothetical protein